MLKENMPFLRFQIMSPNDILSVGLDCLQTVIGHLFCLKLHLTVSCVAVAKQTPVDKKNYAPLTPVRLDLR